jgi:hypothetical protein
MILFYIAVSLLCASTLMYEIVLTRLLSTICWYYLAFVSVSMAMFGMTAGAVAVKMMPKWFPKEDAPIRLIQATFAMALSMPISLVIMLAIPLEVSLSVETIFSFLLFSSVIAAPFFFAGVAVCLCLTRMPYLIGRIYFADLTGASLGCVAAVALLKIIDAPSGMILIGAILSLSAAMFARHFDYAAYQHRSNLWGLGFVALAALNACTLHGIQPIWSKGTADLRNNIAAELWNPISRVRAFRAEVGNPSMWGPSPMMPSIRVEEIGLQIDSDAATAIAHFQGDLRPFDYLRYDVTSLGAELRAGGTAAIIGVGGGRDVLNASVNGFRRIVGIEVNSAIVAMDTKKFASFSGFSNIPGFELHTDEGRSYLSRTGEKFDLIQASLVDTWAATSAGALTLAENSLYTVDGWRIFYEHLKPGGVITFSRWYYGPEASQTYRLFSVAYATLLSEGVKDPMRNIALVSAGKLATILVSNQALTEADLARLRNIVDQMKFQFLCAPDQETQIPELQNISSRHTIADLNKLRDESAVDLSPVFDSSPYFFNAVRFSKIPQLLKNGGKGSNLRALVFVFLFMIAALVLVVLAILLPLRQWAKSRVGVGPLKSGIVYFVAIGIGFMLLEMAMIQQFSLFLGHPVYSLAVVLAGLILFTGIGSVVSDRFPVTSSIAVLIPAAVVVVIIILYSFTVNDVIHQNVSAEQWKRVSISLAMSASCGFPMGFCFPIGLRWLRTQKQEDNLPWMWALNGAAATLGSFVAIFISMESTITTCALSGAACYLVAALSLVGRREGVAYSGPLFTGALNASRRDEIHIISQRRHDDSGADAFDRHA